MAGPHGARLTRPGAGVRVARCAGTVSLRDLRRDLRHALPVRASHDDRAPAARTVGGFAFRSIASRGRVRMSLRASVMMSTAALMPGFRRASARSTLLMTTMGLRPISSALDSTKRVCGIGPSAASMSTSAPSAIRTTRSTSPPKSACPGVSMILK